MHRGQVRTPGDVYGLSWADVGDGVGGAGGGDGWVVRLAAGVVIQLTCP